jgi:hypothetical protein
MKFVPIISAILLTTSLAHAGLDRTTVHSRANCLNNESITWYYAHPYNWRVVSIHEWPGQTTHHEDTGFVFDSRVAVVHWGEGNERYRWNVSGYHYLYEYHRTIPFDSTFANNCNYIEGW